ncbi:kinase-like domain-containing protein [Desarmillaria tabescens]|uniref:Kinase-like domain-containing protein n=1 Tax=Armillaria tabescens TaxID=1929756 RepID=A0AA39NB83_ARMTA|nr:kinase-like domain-containing protein [Desarmillaria tabescens]KAK0462426.1 kinase-like domain-containing protein [Desarmillaria tabescens]
MDVSPTTQIIWQICDALAYLHIQGVTHRDIKPENILLSKDSKDVPPIVKLSDFGMAKIVDDHTMLRTACGTPEYMPSEQGQHGGSYDHLVDSWSVGVIVFQMFTETLPIERLDTGDQRPDDWDPLMRWDLLDKARVLEEGKRFVRALLRSNPKERMTMKNAPKHQWMSPWVGKMEKARDELLGDNAAYQHLNYLENYRLEEEPET